MMNFPRPTRRQLLWMAGLGAAALTTPQALAETPDSLAEQAYIWGFPIVQTRLYLRGLRQKGLSANQFYGAPRLATPADKAAAGPNVDTIYGVIWFDLAAEPQILSVPDTNGRYYSIQLMDAYENSFAYIGRRATGTAAGKFALAGPNWQGQLPPGVALLRAPTNTVGALSRILVDGPADQPAALALQNAISTTPLSAYPRIARPAQTLENPGTLMPVLHPATLGAAYFDELAAALVDYPPPPADRAFVRSLAALGITPGSTPSTTADATLRAALTAGIAAADQRIQARFKGGMTQVGSWRARYNVTPQAPTPLDRAAENTFGIGYNINQEALYFFGAKGPDNQVLNGGKSYILRFPAGQLPPVDAFWSLTLYGPDFLLQENPIHRYAIGDRTQGLVKAPDGSLQIQIQHDQPAAGPANWLPTPPGPYQLLLRTYQPRPALIDGSYRVPALAFA